MNWIENETFDAFRKKENQIIKNGKLNMSRIKPLLKKEGYVIYKKKQKWD
jgi:hypothetical protein|tara:strand:+ start:129 stop:278 length:150 start_codon:yes stop_codon:yes gene_type:complete